ncbi:MAG: Vi polysaccharide biosynthesis protein VipA/TviB [Rhodanobacter sp. 68-29]|uniref:Vi polysaccharide biosynthesis UDP-N-acetylglucosamine C-6 dehydrogenase TviB n=1 Tax=Rhodanobacter sp. PCA2 TaxID=2006117 RepID=UPI00086E9E4F|nr:Vi polysaccharide biosynthesis UDP-N-acetylglucosamine C-6 dehydrogenase TviB [Rhodanobacter sp. PCA2]MBA2079810.1 Vi polysaccharide biosynthesis protein VipA/TviB [Rhodanobacter sp. PCA2]MBN8924942.1 Vi polysaccharide biosynthesis UDP-N-acetylglucosamine C-6 dehydrogenase TviB [Rhodanobacter sp.]ODU73291.1 MAG: Vi polysaccharide biosynthesis protein VipA/TviB [Rhodanobacter sp. SCN 69-32]OJY57600.1 MAG: Vi polysaccharide biosynthesis protein VipA/TviB [Rhodanobacter sp. 68-29]
MRNLEESRIAIIGLGYVGLPLAVEFGRHYDTLGFDINQARIDELRAGHDQTLEVDAAELAAATRLRFSAALDDLRACNVYIVTVPTPIDHAKRPDLTPLVKASQTLAKVLKKGDVVVYESTVYPGCTEEVCVPILAEGSGLVFNRDFFAGYSPERINPGDKQHRVTTILKVTSGSTPEVADFVNRLYGSIITAGTHQASSIKVAEAAKVIENTQRDLNIALVNDLAILFNKLGIDTLEVLQAAGTKWNFLPFRPGLVGGHCISVDPYYLTHKAQEVGHHPDVILAGRRTNDGMGPYIAGEVIRLMVRKGINPVNARVLLLGLAFKENCPDLRNTRVVDIVQALRGYNATVDVHDPWVNAAEAAHEYGLTPVADPPAGAYDAVIVAVGHRQFVALGADGVRAYGKPAAVVYDVKYVLPRDAVDGRL